MDHMTEPICQDLAALIAKIHAFAQERDWQQYHSPKNLSMALMVEAAELAEHFQWLTEEESRALGDTIKAEVAEEIADVFIYLVYLADLLGIDPVAAAHAKVALNARKYPADLVRGRADKYSFYKNIQKDKGQQNS